MIFLVISDLDHIYFISIKDTEWRETQGWQGPTQDHEDGVALHFQLAQPGG